MVRAQAHRTLPFEAAAPPVHHENSSPDQWLTACDLLASSPHPSLCDDGVLAATVLVLAFREQGENLQRGSKPAKFGVLFLLDPLARLLSCIGFGKPLREVGYRMSIKGYFIFTSLLLASD